MFLCALPDGVKLCNERAAEPLGGFCSVYMQEQLRFQAHPVFQKMIWVVSDGVFGPTFVQLSQHLGHR